MEFEEAVKTMKKGLKIRRKTWKEDSHWRLNKNGQLIDSESNILNDWEVVYDELSDREEKELRRLLKKKYQKELNEGIR